MSNPEIFSAGQVIFRVRISDSVSLAAVEGVETRLEVRSGAGAYRPSPLTLRPIGHGMHILAANFREIEAKLRTGITTRFRLTVSKRGYGDATKTLLIPKADWTRVDQPVTIAGVAHQQATFQGAPFEMDISLVPKAVRLAGAVVRDNDLEAPITGAEITVDGAIATTTDAAGRFIIAALPLAQTVEIAARDGPETAAILHVTDFKRPTNLLSLSINTEPTN